MTDEVAVRQGRGLAEVVEQSRQSQLGPIRGQGVGGAQRVVQRVARQGLRLRHAPQRRQLGQEHGHQPQALHQGQRGRWRRDGRRGAQHAQQLVADTLTGQGRDLTGVGDDCRLGRRVQRQAQPGRKAHRSHHAQGVLAEAFCRSPHRSQHPAPQVADPVVRVDQRALARFQVGRPPGDGVDCEVAACEVVGQRCSPTHVLRPAAIEIGAFVTVGGDLDVRIAANGDGAEPVLPARAGKQGGDPLRRAQPSRCPNRWGSCRSPGRGRCRRPGPPPGRHRPGE